MGQRNTNGVRPASAAHLLSLLRGHGLSLRIREAAAFVIRCAAFFLGFVLLVVAFDHVLVRGLPRAALVLCSLALLATLLAGGVALGHRLSRRYGDRFVAREYERTFGVAHNAMLNWLFVRGDQAVEYASAAGAAQAEAEIVSPHGTIAPSAPPRGQWLWLGGVAIAWGLFAAVTPKDIPASLRRLLGSLEPAPSATRIELSRPGPKDAVYAGQPLTLEFVLSGRSSERLAVELLSNGDAGAETLVRHIAVRRAPRGAPDVRSIQLAGNEVARDV
ncbi:MAG: hypothetical protein HZB38_17775, partial [Planctomycetes bacterium]|nr:hypothetical protein [Planctomycetota bacterium]